MNCKEYDVVVVGTGAAGYNAACRIKEDGRKSVCMITEGVNMGTSRNTGSDKQTYYKLGLGGSANDSVRNMAENLFAGGCVDGDNALCEAALSSRCFFNLCELGVEFPCNRYGEYVGYKTDHDPYARATSAGPLTSKFMTEVLQKRAEELNVEVHNNCLAIEVLSENNKVYGLLCVSLTSGEFVVYKTKNIVLATGGPAGVYSDSVYPIGHSGSTGLALNAGADLQNMTEWQYGLASVSPRWNVSGTYMQVLPRFVSVDENGSEYEFLSEYYDDIYEAMSAVFLKGYQWPFDIKKATDGSSVIDLLVYRECNLRNRRVYLDFTKNPFGLEKIEFEKLSKEAYEYLKSAEAFLLTPIERLAKMNQPAIRLYKDKGVDIYNSYLEIALCAQHNNGGIAVDAWWQSSVKGLFAVGECAGTHGVARPGGSALNAGQVGSLRAAQYICASEKESVDDGVFLRLAGESLANHKKFYENALNNANNIHDQIKEKRKRMSTFGGAIRQVELMEKVCNEIKYEISNFDKLFGIDSINELHKLYRLRDMLVVQLAMLTSMMDFSENVGVSRGSALYYDKEGHLLPGMEEQFRFNDNGAASANGKIQMVSYTNTECLTKWREVRPIPEDGDFFENVWRQYRENKNIY